MLFNKLNHIVLIVTMQALLAFFANAYAADIDDLEADLLKKNSQIRVLTDRLKKLERLNSVQSKKTIKSDTEITILKQNLKRSMSLIESLTARISDMEANGVAAADSGASAKINADSKRQLEISSRQIETMNRRIVELEASLTRQESAAAARERELLQKLQNKIDSIDTEEDAEFVVFDELGDESTVNAFDALSLNIGGFLNGTLTHIEGENGTATSFNRLVAELLIRAELNEQWSAFIAQAFIRESDIEFTDPGARFDPGFQIVNKAPLVIAWANFQKSDAFNIRFGRFITPHGIVNIEHFPATILDTEQPKFLRPFGGETIFPNFVNGIMVHGNTYVGPRASSKLQYSLYAAQFVNNADDFLVGGRLDYTFGDSGVTVGLNAFEGTRANAGRTDYTGSGIDLLVDRGKILWKTEFFATDEEDGVDREGYYTQPAVRLTPKWLLFYRYDYLDKGLATGIDTGPQTEDVVGLNYTPYSNVRIRFILKRREFEGAPGFPEAEADIFQFSSTFSF